MTIFDKIHVSICVMFLLIFNKNFGTLILIEKLFKEAYLKKKKIS